MQFSYFTTVFLCAAVVSAGCYKRGDAGNSGNGHYGQGLNRNNIIDAVADLMHGDYLAGEERTQCAMDDYQNKWKFRLQNDDGKTRTVSKDQVKKWLGDEAYACQYGGHNWKESFDITSDPNPGECVSSKHDKRRDVAVDFHA